MHGVVRASMLEMTCAIDCSDVMYGWFTSQDEYMRSTLLLPCFKVVPSMTYAFKRLLLQQTANGI